MVGKTAVNATLFSQQFYQPCAFSPPSVSQALARCLERGAFIGQCGTYSATITGARGIGKSTTFVNFTHLLPSFHSDVIPIYINYAGVKASRLLLNNSLLDCVISELEKHGISLDTNKYRESEGNVYHLNTLLQEKGKFVMLMVDEMDKFYEVTPELSIRANETFGELAALGDSVYGRVAVILCGSSGVLPILVNASARSLGYLSDYPLLKVASNLNGTKFRSHRLPTSPPTDISIVGNIMNHHGFGNNEAFVKQIAFLSGSVPRNIDALLFGTFEMGGLSLEAQKFEASRPECAQLWSLMMKEMYKKNLGLMQALSNHKDGINMEQVVKLDWPNEFRPLTSDDVGSIWKTIDINKTRNSFSDIEKDLYFLYDHDLIYFRPSYNWSIQQIYPSNMLNVFTYPLHSSLMAEVEKLFEKSLQTIKNTSDALDTIKNINF